MFEEFDFHFDGITADPTTAKPISITLTFEESEAGKWSEEIERQLGLSTVKHQNKLIVLTKRFLPCPTWE